MPKKPSFFERLAGGVPLEEGREENLKPANTANEWLSDEEGQLTVDVYQNPDSIVIKTMVAGVRPEDLSISITRNMVTIKGRRSKEDTISEDDYFFRELYWGSFSRTVLLPEEVDPGSAQAFEKHGLLTIKLPKIDKERTSTVKIKSL